MRIGVALLWLAIFGLCAVSAGCGEEPECTGAAVSGPAVTCGTTGAFERTVCVDGKLRVFREYVPATVTCDVPPPLIVFLHGNGRNEAAGEVAHEVVDQLGAVYVTPRGYDQGGYLGFGPEGIPNSRAFLTKIVDEIKKEFPTDPEFTLLTGFSGGAFFSSYCIAWLNDRLAGVGIFGAGIAENFVSDLLAAPVKLPVLVRIGNQDTLRNLCRLARCAARLRRLAARTNRQQAF